MFAQGLEFHRSGDCTRGIGTEHEHAVVGHQAGGAVLQGGQHGIRQGLGAVGGIGGTTHVRSAETQHHIVKRRNCQRVTGQRRRGGRMRVHHRAHLGPGTQHIVMHAPFGRWFACPAYAPGKIHPDKVRFGERIRRDARGGDQEALTPAQTGVARRACVQATLAEFAKSLQECTTRGLFILPCAGLLRLTDHAPAFASSARMAAMTES